LEDDLIAKKQIKEVDEDDEDSIVEQVK